MKKKTLAKLIPSLLFFGGLAYFVKVEVLPEFWRWEGYAFSLRNSGQNPVLLGEYRNKSLCLQEMQKQMRKPVAGNNDIPVDAFICGQSCANANYIDEMKCAGKPVFSSDAVKKYVEMQKARRERDGVASPR